MDFERFGYLTDHRVKGLMVYPGASYVETMLEAVLSEYPETRPASKYVPR